MLSTNPSSTIEYDRELRVHLVRPCSGLLHDRAIKWASTSPSIFFQETFWVYWCLDKTASNSSSISCLRTYSLVCTVMSNASLIFSSGHAGSLSLWFALSSIRIRVNRLTVPRPDVNIFFKVVCSPRG